MQSCTASTRPSVNGTTECIFNTQISRHAQPTQACKIHCMPYTLLHTRAALATLCVVTHITHIADAHIARAQIVITARTHMHSHPRTCAQRCELHTHKHLTTHPVCPLVESLCAPPRTLGACVRSVAAKRLIEHRIEKGGISAVSATSGRAAGTRESNVQRG